MESLPLTVCPSQLQLNSTDDQSLAALEARMLQGFYNEGYLHDMSSLDPLPFPAIIPDPAPSLPLVSEVPAPALSSEVPHDEDFFADLPPPSYSSEVPLGEDFFFTGLPTDYSAALLASWEADSAAAPAYEAPVCSGAVPVPVAVGHWPETPASSSRPSSADSAPCGWGWPSASVSAPAPMPMTAPGALPGYMTPPGYASWTASAAGMAMAMAMPVEEVNWEALLGLSISTLAPAPAPFPASAPPAAPTFFPAPGPAPTTTGPSTTKPKPKPKAAAPAARRERKTTRRREAKAAAPAPGTIVFAPNIVPASDVYVSAYSHTREYALDERGRVLKRRRYEDKVGA